MQPNCTGEGMIWRKLNFLLRVGLRFARSRPALTRLWLLTEFRSGRIYALVPEVTNALPVGVPLLYKKSQAI